MVQVIRAELEAIVRDLSWREGAAVMRIAAALEGKADPAGYWRSRGRARFARELVHDGLDATLVEAVFSVIDELLVPETELDAALHQLRRRYLNVGGEAYNRPAP